MYTQVDLSNVSNNSQNELIQSVDNEQIKALGFGGIDAQAVNGFSYRHDWGNLKGLMKLNLSWSSITNQSKVFVSICEFGGGSNQGFIGDAACPKLLKAGLSLHGRLQLNLPHHRGQRLGHQAATQGHIPTNLGGGLHGRADLDFRSAQTQCQTIAGSRLHQRSLQLA